LSKLSPTAWVTTEKIFAQAFGLIVFAIQAPLLGPHAFGLLSVVMVFVGFWEAVPGFAATDALISVRVMDAEHVTGLLVVTGVSGAIVGLAVMGAANPLARALGYQELAPIMYAMAVLPLLNAVSIVPTAMAMREMRFRSLTLRTTVSLAAGGTTGLVLAVAGAGAWALVFQALVQRIVGVMILWSVVPVPLSRRPSLRHVLELLVFAVPNTVSRGMSWSSGQLPRLILGFHLGPTLLGLFTLATRLNDVVTQVAIAPKTQVARVALCRHVNNPEALNKAVAQTFTMTGLIAFPICIGGAAVMVPLVETWLDARWLPAIVPCQLLLLMGVPFVTIYVAASLLLALNKQFWEAVICTAQSLATVASVALVATYGVTAAAAAIACVALATVPLAMYIMWRICGVSLRAICGSQLPLLAASCVMGLVVCAIRLRLEPWLGALASLPLEIFIGAILYAGLILLLLPKLALAVTGNRLKFLVPGS
jgi:PST family polysaccharide transporter